MTASPQTRQHSTGQHSTGQHSTGQPGTGQPGTSPYAGGSPRHIPRRLPTPSAMLSFERPIERAGERAGERALHSVPAPAPRQPVRLTRRGRVVVLLTLVALLLVAFVLGRAGSSQAATHRPGQVAPAVSYRQTTVRPGESLWAVARRVAPGQDPRAFVLELRELNHLPSGAVAVGQQLLLPS